MKTDMQYRIEKDTMGEVKVPADKLWGAQTERSFENFKIGPKASMPLEIIYGFAYLKKAAAYTNCDLGVLSEEKRDELDQAIKASGEVLSVFPNTLEYDFIIKKLINSISAFAKETELFSEEESPTIADYIFKDLQSDSEFVGSNRALEIKDDFLKTLKEKKVDIKVWK